MKTRKKKIMRLILVVMMVELLPGIVIANYEKNYGGSIAYFEKKQRTSPRLARDFRPNPLSTASGFGKRKDPFIKIMESENGHHLYSPIFVSTLNPTKRTTTYWFIQYMRRHPDISKTLFKIELSNIKKTNQLLMDQLFKLTNLILFFK